MNIKSRSINLLLSAIVVAAIYSDGQNLVCSGGSFSDPMFCTVNDVPLVCKSAVGGWMDGNLTYPGYYHYTVSTQDSNGNLTGTYDDGDFHLNLSGLYDVETGTGYWDVPFPDEGLGPSTERTGFTLEPPGCNTLRGLISFEEDPGGWSAVTWYLHNQSIPSGSPAETTSFLSWAGEGTETIGEWNQTLNPASTRFGGQAVREDTYADNDLTYGSADSCWFPGSAFPEAKNSNGYFGGHWIVQADNTFGPDYVGWRPEVVEYYQAYEDPGSSYYPCGFRSTQKMISYTNDFDSYSGDTFYTTTNYQNNRLGADIWPSSVSSIKSGHTQTRLWP